MYILIKIIIIIVVIIIRIIIVIIHQLDIACVEQHRRAGRVREAEARGLRESDTGALLQRGGVAQDVLKVSPP